MSLLLPSLAKSPLDPKKPLCSVTLVLSVLSLTTPPLHLGVQLSPNPTKPPLNLLLVTSLQTRVTSAFRVNSPIIQDTVAISHQNAGKLALNMKPNPGRVVEALFQKSTMMRLRVPMEGPLLGSFSSEHSVQLRCYMSTATLKETTAIWTGSKGTVTRTQRCRRMDRSHTFTFIIKVHYITL